MSTTSPVPLITSPLPARKLPIPNVLIVGESGWGKTRSLKNMPWNETAFIDTERKGFDWISKIPEGHYFECTDYKGTLAKINLVKQDMRFKYICIDSLTGFSNMAFEQCKAQYKNYDIYNFYTSAIFDFLKACLSKEQRIIVTAIPECLSSESEGNTTGATIKRAKVYGRQCEGQVEPMFAYSLYLKVIALPGKKAEHKFVLQSDGKNQAKVPEGVFGDTLEVENDLASLLKTMEKGGQ